MYDIKTIITPGAPAVWMYADEPSAVYERLSDKNVSLIAVSGVDWEAELSPWSAKRAFKGGADFAGGAGAHLEKLIKMMPEIELGMEAASRAICGYSLAGLFAVYASLNCDRFGCAISVSGSLWFDGFIEFLLDSEPKSGGYYLSLGDTEPKARNPRLAAVGECTLKTADILRSKEADVFFEWNAGNHFADPKGRIAKGIDWYLQKQ